MSIELSDKNIDPTPPRQWPVHQHRGGSDADSGGVDEEVQGLLDILGDLQGETAFISTMYYSETPLLRHPLLREFHYYANI